MMSPYRSENMSENKLKLDEVVYDPRARGAFCKHEYEGHRKGCPNWPVCIEKRPDFKEFGHLYEWYAVMEVFDLKAHAEKMKLAHPGWGDRMCRNLLYWQGGVRKRLYQKAVNAGLDIILDIPEANGIEVFLTMAKVGVTLERKPDTVVKVMLVGRKI